MKYTGADRRIRGGRRVHPEVANRASVQSSAHLISSQSDRSTLTWVAIAFIVLSLVAKFVGGGLAVFIFAVPYLLACGIHLWIHRRAATRLAIDAIDLVVIFSSHIALLCGFLLQVDGIIDGPVFVTVTALFGHYGVPAWLDVWAPFVGVPAAVSWVVLFILPTRLGRTAGVKVAGASLVGVLALVLVIVVVALVLTS